MACDMKEAEDPFCKICQEEESKHGMFTGHKFEKTPMEKKVEESFSVPGGLSNISIGGKTRKTMETLRVIRRDSQFDKIHKALIREVGPNILQEDHNPMDIPMGMEMPQMMPDPMMPDPAQEGGVGSGIKGHTTAKDDPEGRPPKGSTPGERGMGSSTDDEDSSDAFADTLEQAELALDAVDEQYDELDVLYQEMYERGDSKRKGLEKVMDALENASVQLEDWVEELRHEPDTYGRPETDPNAPAEDNSKWFSVKTDPKTGKAGKAEPTEPPTYGDDINDLR